MGDCSAYWQNWGPSTRDQSKSFITLETLSWLIGPPQLTCMPSKPLTSAAEFL